MNPTSTPRGRGPISTALALATFAGLTAFAAPAAAQDPANPWLSNRFLNMAHQGGELEAPSNTMYALKSAVSERGADALEIDVNATSDDELIVIHDQTVDRTTNSTGRVDAKSVAEVQALDAAHWFVPGENTPHSGHDPEDYTFRGVRLDGGPEPPEGYERDDFAHPTLEQVLDAFPNVPINIEIKGDTPPLREHTAELLADVLTTEPYASRDDIIVVSFREDALEAFRPLAPGVDLAASEDELLPWALDHLGGAGTATLPPGTVALQVPPIYDLGGGNIVDVPATLLGPDVNAHCKDYAVHIWTRGEADENAETYGYLIGLGVDGIMTQTPGLLADYLDQVGYPQTGPPNCEAPPPPPPDPALTVSVEVGQQNLKSALKTGISAKTECSRTCDVALEATVAKRDAKKRGLWRKGQKGTELVLGSATLTGVTDAAEGRIAITGKKLRKRLSKLRGKLPITVAAEATTPDGASAAAEADSKLQGKKKKRKRRR